MILIWCHRVKILCRTLAKQFQREREREKKNQQPHYEVLSRTARRCQLHPLKPQSQRFEISETAFLNRRLTNEMFCAPNSEFLNFLVSVYIPRLLWNHSVQPCVKSLKRVPQMGPILKYIATRQRGQENDVISSLSITHDIKTSKLIDVKAIN